MKRDKEKRGRKIEETQEKKERRDDDMARGIARRTKRSEEGEEAGHCAIRKWLTTYTCVQLINVN